MPASQPGEVLFNHLDLCYSAHEGNMDTALITFMTQTIPSIQSVHLIGSWDNFSKHYAMERDARRSRGQWRGCYAFTDIICDGDGGSSPKRTGGLKMGSTYYYYYELDGTEYYDPSLPSTTSCPYLPGQPVNLLLIPIEIQPLRFRSASMSSLVNLDIKTVNPADRFMTPRPPPAPPAVSPRLSTSPFESRSLKADCCVWLKKTESSFLFPKNFFGIRSRVVPVCRDKNSIGRSSMYSRSSKRNINAGTISTHIRSVRQIKSRSNPHTREASPGSLKQPQSKDASRLPQAISRDPDMLNEAALVLRRRITEDVRDDDNSASHLDRSSPDDRDMSPCLSPSTAWPHPRALQVCSTTNAAKPLPFIRKESVEPLYPQVRADISAAELPRSHFSMSTISTVVSSPTDSHFSFNDRPSFSNSYDEDIMSADFGCSDESRYSPLLEKAPGTGFGGYSLPDQQYNSQRTIRRETSILALDTSWTQTTSSDTVAIAPNASAISGSPNVLIESLRDMQYLGGLIFERK